MQAGDFMHMNKQNIRWLCRLATFVLLALVAVAGETSTTKEGEASGSSEVAASNPPIEEVLAAILSRLDRLESKIASIESEQRNQLSGLRTGVQTALTQIGMEIGDMKDSIARLKKVTKPLTSTSGEKPAQP